VVTPGAGLKFIYRTATNGSLTTVSVSGAVPCWVKLVRSGSQFSAYRSSDGVNWTLIGSKSISMASSAYVGLAVGSKTTSLSTATFDNVSTGAAAAALAVPASLYVISPSTSSTFSDLSRSTLDVWEDFSPIAPAKSETLL
jgi:hypothetical protein